MKSQTRFFMDLNLLRDHRDQLFFLFELRKLLWTCGSSFVGVSPK